MKFHEIRTLTGRLILTRAPGITWPTIPVIAPSALKTSPYWQLIVLWLCGLIGRCMARRPVNNRVPLRHKMIFLAIVATIVIPVLIEKLRF
jgi:hypothetical protein